MAGRYRSEIRDSVIRDLIDKVKKQNFGSYLRRVRLTKVRAFRNEEVAFDFPVTALVGTNGGGKSTILGAAAIAFANKSIKPALFFPKSSVGDDSMADWSIGFDIVDKKTNATHLIQRSARFKNLKWARDDLVERPVIYFGIQRTVPAGERREFKRFATNRFKYNGTLQALGDAVREQVTRVLGKDMTHFNSADVSSSRRLYVGGDGEITYSEFHFGAGESSIIRMVGEMEAAPENSLVLIEELENGLHPVAVRRMVEYLIDIAERKSIQSIFTTHSEDALAPLPPEAIWSSIDGRVQQGRISIEALRAISGRIDERIAVFVEDAFAKEWVESMIRAEMPGRIDEVGVYAVSGGERAAKTHLSHRANPAVNDKIKCVCVVDGDSAVKSDEANGITRLPGAAPETCVFNHVRKHINALGMRLAVGMHLAPEKEADVKRVVEDVSNTNRDPHLLFNQVGQKSGMVSESVTRSAFIALWNADHPVEVRRIAEFVRQALDDDGPKSGS